MTTEALQKKEKKLLTISKSLNKTHSHYKSARIGFRLVRARKNYDLPRISAPITHQRKPLTGGIFVCAMLHTQKQKTDLHQHTHGQSHTDVRKNRVHFSWPRSLSIPLALRRF